MKKSKILLALLTAGIACSLGVVAFAGCDDGNQGDTGNGDEIIGDNDSPLGGADCKHAGVQHKTAKQADCTTAGNLEYWYCVDCGKYFSDSGLTVETSLASVTVNASHKYGELIPATSNECQQGMKAHYYCEACETYFNADKTETTLLELALAPAHDLKYNEAEDLPVEDDPDICYYHYGEYWECNDCGLFFGDKWGSQILDEDLMDIMTDVEHGYGDFAYDYASKKYIKVCSHNAEHTEEQTAGSEEYPYLANSVDTLKSALALGGYVKLEANLNTTETITIANAVNLDLNGKTITSTVGAFTLSGNANVTLINGTVTAGKNATNASAPDEGNTAVYATDNASVYLKNVNASGYNGIVGHANGVVKIEGGIITGVRNGLHVSPVEFNYAYEDRPAYIVELNVSDNAKIVSENFVGVTTRATNAIFVNSTVHAQISGILTFRETTLTMTDCTVTGVTNCGIQGNGTVPKNKSCGLDVTYNLTNCTVKGLCVGVYLPQFGGETTISGGTYEGEWSAVEVRSGTVSITGATLTSTLTEFDSPATGANGSGATIHGSALAVSQHTTNDVIRVTLNGCTFNGVYAIYEKDFQDEAGRDITVTLEGDNKYNGGIYSQNCDSLKAIAKEPALA